jgi:translation initiation factor 1
MSRQKDNPAKKLDVSRAAAPLQSNPFALLGELDALKNLPPAPEPAPVVAVPAKPKKSRGRLVLRRETKSRGGKTVVIVSGFAELPGASAVLIADLAKDLKGKLGCGGTFDREEIVLQGDRAAAVCALLEDMGYSVAGVRE